MRLLSFLLVGMGLLLSFVAASIWIFYTQTDSRGVREWDSAKKALQAHGETTDFRALIPPEIPDDQNLAAIPLFRLETVNGEVDQPVTLKTALAKIEPEHSSLPRTGGWTKAEMTDMAPIKKYLDARYAEVIGGDAPSGMMEEIDALFPGLEDLRQAAAMRPQTRFAHAYFINPPYNRPLSSTTLLIKLGKIINLHGMAALREDRFDLALSDTELNLRLSEGLRREPVLISGLVAAGVMAIQLGTVWEGLNTHAWSDAQLAELQVQLHPIDFLSDYQLCLRGEAVGFLAPIFDWMRDHNSANALLGSMSANPSQRAPNLFRLFGWLTPRGWYDEAKADGVTLYYDAARESVDLRTHRTDPEIVARFQAKSRSSAGYTLPSLFLRSAQAPVIISGRNFSEAQFRVDAAYLACALERYRLAFGKYPASLDELAPYAPQGLPTDIIGGGPYRYKLYLFGTFSLYSVGWNQKDDGGQVAYKKDDPKTIDPDQGDWIWPKRKF